MLAGLDGKELRTARPAGGTACVLLSGGETTVTLPVGSAGRGGRNTEFLLALALALGEGIGGGRTIHALAADTDGIDGSGTERRRDHFPDTLQRARAAGIDPGPCSTVTMPGVSLPRSVIWSRPARR